VAERNRRKAAGLEKKSGQATLGREGLFTLPTSAEHSEKGKNVSKTKKKYCWTIAALKKDAGVTKGVCEQKRETIREKKNIGPPDGAKTGWSESENAR